MTANMRRLLHPGRKPATPVYYHLPRVNLVRHLRNERDVQLWLAAAANDITGNCAAGRFRSAAATRLRRRFQAVIEDRGTGSGRQVLSADLRTKTVSAAFFL